VGQLHEVQESEVGERIVMGTGLGMTESGPFALYVTGPDVKSGHVGLPTPGMELKLVPTDGKTEVRYRGPNITPGYWRAPEATAEAFDEEGFFCTGDAVLWIDDADIHRGLRFDGRIAEDFKLATGTFVSVGPLRAKIIAAGAPYVQDAVLTGINLQEVGALLFPTPRCATRRPAVPTRRCSRCWKAPPCRRTSSRCSTNSAPGHRQRQPHRAAAPDARAALHRQGRGHRQGLHQPARRAQAPRRAGAGLARRHACPSP
jgi:hypothetical protein